MKMSKNKLIAAVTTLTLGFGFTMGVAPAFADSNQSVLQHASISSIEKEEHPFTGYVISIDDMYMVVANTSTQEDALFYKDDWWELASQNKILRVPISTGDDYVLGEKLNIYATAWSLSIPPIAIAPTIEKIAD
ncbi:DUF3221 domain-containing protein [Brevibacillus laterosporus]|uniref:DUF3221 domain-containing protein n=1 Tax=Brevibacillus laterosporus TaxID=1465 RepID=UPI0014442962|nr:DUF3221 domain-containing protein [Brevibacillus laterosporus]NKQ20732.1 DUF3221 domain-containing protein [Brevibacillus laterosporus]WNX29659.1 DUF3221 domain-containing protein [Brevibacillus laterosporus]